MFPISDVYDVFKKSTQYRYIVVQTVHYSKIHPKIQNKNIFFSQFHRQNKWCAVSPMSTRRKHLGCAVFNNYIYAVGGRDDCMELSSAERYNPHTNTWSPIVAMTSRRSGVSNRFFYIILDALSSYCLVIISYKI